MLSWRLEWKINMGLKRRSQVFLHKLMCRGVLNSKKQGNFSGENYEQLQLKWYTKPTCFHWKSSDPGFVQNFRVKISREFPSNSFSWRSPYSNAAWTWFGMFFFTRPTMVDAILCHSVPRWTFSNKLLYFVNILFFSHLFPGWCPFRNLPLKGCSSKLLTVNVVKL